jgi:hypothetical protein
MPDRYIVATYRERGGEEDGPCTPLRTGQSLMGAPVPYSRVKTSRLCPFGSSK